MTRLIALVALALTVAVVGGCGNGGQLVVVKVVGSRNAVASLGVALKLDGQKARQFERFAANTTDFGLELQPGAKGTLEIIVGGFDAQSCVVSIASSTVQAGSGAAQLDVTVTLTAVSPPSC